ncbi:MAG: hypothetical protein ABR89_12315 [Rhodobacter sp. BACL10 MAG-120910-bin24]|nr:MAG: hypothetical protein ABR89_12315 [Rhodobacter sp. BACL10 MAG-120910-bin24]
MCLWSVITFLNAVAIFLEWQAYRKGFVLTKFVVFIYAFQISPQKSVHRPSIWPTLPAIKTAPSTMH